MVSTRAQSKGKWPSRPAKKKGKIADSHGDAADHPIEVDEGGDTHNSPGKSTRISLSKSAPISKLRCWTGRDPVKRTKACGANPRSSNLGKIDSRTDLVQEPSSEEADREVSPQNPQIDPMVSGTGHDAEGATEGESLVGEGDDEPAVQPDREPHCSNPSERTVPDLIRVPLGSLDTETASTPPITYKRKSVAVKQVRKPTVQKGKEKVWDDSQARDTRSRGKKRSRSDHQPSRVHARTKRARSVPRDPILTDSEDEQPVEMSGTYVPSSFTPIQCHLWKDDLQSRNLLIQRPLDVNQLNALPHIIDLLTDRHLLKSVTLNERFSSTIVREFYCGLNSVTKESQSVLYHQVCVREKQFTFSPASINRFLGRPSVQADSEPKDDDLAPYLANRPILKWPGQRGLKNTQLTGTHRILLSLAVNHWLPATGQSYVNIELARLIFKISKGLPFDLGQLIFDRILSFASGNQKKCRLPYTSLIFEMLKEQVLELTDVDVMVKPKIMRLHNSVLEAAAEEAHGEAEPEENLPTDSDLVLELIQSQLKSIDADLAGLDAHRSTLLGRRKKLQTQLQRYLLTSAPGSSVPDSAPRTSIPSAVQTGVPRSPVP